MSEEFQSALNVQQALRTKGFYAGELGEGDPMVPSFVIEVNDKAGVKLLRRLLTIDVKNLLSGQTRFSYVLNALGHVMDTCWVTHIDDADEHFRVSFFMAETLAWAHQVAKAFDAEFETLSLVSARVFGQAVKDMDLAEAQAGSMTLAGQTVYAQRLGDTLLIQAAELNTQAFEDDGFVMLDWIGANTCTMLADEVNAIDWMQKEKGPVELGHYEALDFTDAYRVFIGRALTEALLKRAPKTRDVLVSSSEGNAQEFFQAPRSIAIMTPEGIELTRTARVGCYGEHLCARIRVSEDFDPQEAVWVDTEGEDGVGYALNYLEK